MNIRFIAAIVVVFLCIGGLVFSAAKETSKAVVTVAELAASVEQRERIRLGARVAQADIEVLTSPEREVRFRVVDPGEGQGPDIPVVYRGAMPDTLQRGRDVILEGDYVEQTFVASSLMTQCPSKYEPPIPQANSEKSVTEAEVVPGQQTANPTANGYGQ